MHGGFFLPGETWSVNLPDSISKIVKIGTSGILESIHSAIYKNDDPEDAIVLLILNLILNFSLSFKLAFSRSISRSRLDALSISCV